MTAEPLDEIGVDFVARRFHATYTPIRRFDQPDEFDDHAPFPELIAMRDALRRNLDTSSGRDAILERILRRTLLEPTGRLYFHLGLDRFVVVEPKIDANDLLQWQEG